METFLLVLPSKLLLKKIDELKVLKVFSAIRMIAPRHGQIWTNTEKILYAYIGWTTGVAENKVKIIYDTMHNSTR